MASGSISRSCSPARTTAPSNSWVRARASDAAWVMWAVSMSK